jgi:hypothetical protein
MCTLGAAGLALGALSSGASALGARQQARMQYQAQMQQIAMQRRLQEQTAAAETRRSLRQMTGERLQQQQQERMIGEEERQEILKAEAAIARTAEDPVTAVAKQREYFALLGQKKFALGEQLEMLQAGKTLALEDQGLGLQQRLMGIRQPIMDPIKPRGLGITDVLSVASGGLQGYMMGQQLSGGMGGVDTSIDVPKGPVRFGGKVYDYQKLA